MSNFFRGCVLVATAIISIPRELPATDKVWSAATTTWWDVGPWSPAGNPTLNDSVTFYQPGTYEVLFDDITGDPTINDFFFNGGNVTFSVAAGLPRTLNVNGMGGGNSMRVSGGSLTLGKNSSPSPIVISIPQNLTVESGGAVHVTNGSNLTALGDIHVDNGTLDYQSGGIYLSPGRSLVASNGGQINLNTSFGIPHGSIFQIVGGADTTVAGFVDVGSVFGGASLTVDGPGSSIAVNTDVESWWGQSGVNTISFSNYALGNYPGGIRFSPTGAIGTLTNAFVQSGAQITIGNLAIGTSGGQTTDTLTVSGFNSAVTLNPNRGFVIGSPSGALALLNVSNGGSFAVGDGGTTFVDKTAWINIDGGYVDLKAVYTNGGIVSLYSGSLSFLGNLSTGVDGLLGANPVLSLNRNVKLDGETIVPHFHSLTISGGKLTTGSLSVDGTIAFTSGTLEITGVDGLAFDSGKPLGQNYTLGSDRTIAVTNGVSVANGAVLTIAGGLFSSGGTLVNAGNVVLDSGSIMAAAINVSSSGAVYVGPNKTATFSLGGVNAGEVLLDGASATIAGAGTLTNSGLIRGDGWLQNPLSNTAIGEIRAEANKRLRITGLAGANLGSINLQGGTVEINSLATNGATGVISGRGLLLVGGAGLTNNGHIALSSGITDVYGDIVNNTGNAARGISISGNTDVTFWDDVNNVSGSLFRVSAGSSVTLFGSYGGAGISGPGDVYFEADVTPGASPATASFGGNVSLGANSAVEIELGGTLPGVQYDQLHVAGLLSLDGTLRITFINDFIPAAGNAFDILDWGALSGAFSTITLPTLPIGKAWNTSQLYASGVISVSAALIPGDFDSDGDVDGADFVAWQTHFPTSTGAALADGDADGDGDVDGADFVVWQTHFPTFGGAAAAPVPEPAPGILLLGAAAAMIVQRFRRIR